MEHHSFPRGKVQEHSDFKPFSAMRDQKKIKRKIDTDLCATCKRRLPARRLTTSKLAASTDPTFDSWLAVFELGLPSCLPSAPGGSPFSLPSGLECRLHAMQLAKNVVAKNDGGCSDERVSCRRRETKKSRVGSSNAFDKPERCFCTDRPKHCYMVGRRLSPSGILPLQQIYHLLVEY